MPNVANPPLTAAEFAEIRSGLTGTQRRATDADIQRNVDARMKAPNPVNQTSWLQIPRARQAMYEDINPNIGRIWDDPNSQFAQQARVAEYKAIRDPKNTRLSNLHREYMGPKAGEPNSGLAGHRFNDNAREGFYQRMGMVLPGNYKSTGDSAGWGKTYLDRFVPPVATAAAPSPSPSPAPMTPAPMVPPPPGASPNAMGASPITPPPLGKQGSAMTDKQMFKVAFLAKCVEDGLTLDQIHVRVKQALVLAEKKANKDGNSFWDSWNPLAIAKDISWAGLAGAGVVGAGGYYMGNKVLGPGAYHLTKAPIPSKEDLLQEELVNEYDRQTDIIKRQTEMTKRKRERDRGISGVTRY